MHFFYGSNKTLSVSETKLMCFLCSVLLYGSRCEQPVPSRGQCVYRGLSHCAGHTQHFHHGVQGINRDSQHDTLYFLAQPINSPSLFSDPVEFRSRSQSPDEEGFPGALVFSADTSVWGRSQTGLHLTQDFHLQGEISGSMFIDLTWWDWIGL